MMKRMLAAAIWSLFPPMASGQAQDINLPSGPGKELVERNCGLCHSINRIAHGYTPEGWRTVLQMMKNAGAPVTDDEWPVIRDYLIKTFPERDRPAAAIIPGPTHAVIQEWAVPTPGSRPHDPLAARDGSIWWTGQLANKLGRLDPKTGAIKEFELSRPNLGPHGLAEDRDGTIWFTANTAGVIGKLDPHTGSVTEYEIPDREAKDPHTMLFDGEGMVWFTVQAGNRVGRLDPRTGSMALATPPTAGARPYGMALSPDGKVFFVEFGVNKIATVDRATMAIREYTLPDAGARPRRIAFAPDGMTWYTDFAKGYLGRLDPKTGEVKEWLSPSGPRSEPYGIVWTKGALWYSESAAKPNTVVRFDPASETFQTWPIPGGGDIVRNMSVTPDGNPVLANSLMNAVGLVKVE